MEESEREVEQWRSPQYTTYIATLTLLPMTYLGLLKANATFYITLSLPEVCVCSCEHGICTCNLDDPENSISGA